MIYPMNAPFYAQDGLQHTFTYIVNIFSTEATSSDTAGPFVEQ